MPVITVTTGKRSSKINILSVNDDRKHFNVRCHGKERSFSEHKLLIDLVYNGAQNTNSTLIQTDYRDFLKKIFNDMSFNLTLEKMINHSSQRWRNNSMGKYYSTQYSTRVKKGQRRVCMCFCLPCLILSQCI